MGPVDAMMSPMPAVVVRAAVPQDFDAIIDLVAGMFHDLGTTVFPDAWRDDLQQALASRLWDDVAAFVAVDRADVPSPPTDASGEPENGRFRNVGARLPPSH